MPIHRNERVKSRYPPLITPQVTRLKHDRLALPARRTAALRRTPPRCVGTAGHRESFCHYATMERFKAKLKRTIIFVSHDLDVIRYVSHDIAVMYLGCIVEEGKTATVLNAPQHPYTAGLLDSVPRPRPSERAGGGRPPPGRHARPRAADGLGGGMRARRDGWQQARARADRVARAIEDLMHHGVALPRPTPEGHALEIV